MYHFYRVVIRGGVRFLRRPGLRILSFMWKLSSALYLYKDSFRYPPSLNRMVQGLDVYCL